MRQREERKENEEIYKGGNNKRSGDKLNMPRLKQTKENLTMVQKQINRKTETKEQERIKERHLKYAQKGNIRQNREQKNKTAKIINNFLLVKSNM